jgi:hypothetical protein
MAGPVALAIDGVERGRIIRRTAAKNTRTGCDEGAAWPEQAGAQREDHCPDWSASGNQGSTRTGRTRGRQPRAPSQTARDHQQNLMPCTATLLHGAMDCGAGLRQDERMGSVLKVGMVAAALRALAGCLMPPSFTEEEKRELRDSASAYQQDVLEDLVVTESEYRDAVDRTRSCVQDKGWGVGPIEKHDGNQLGFTASYTGGCPNGNHSPADRRDWTLT